MAEALVRLVTEFVVSLALLLLSAGTMRYWEAWVLRVLHLLGGTLVWRYLFTSDPKLAARRMQKKEKDLKQSVIRKVGVVCTLPALVVPGLDRRFGWSHVPVIAVLIADGIVLLTFVWFILVVRENNHASRVIEVEVDQRVVRTGPYAIVRHPMYLGSLVFYLFAPVALGSWWAAMTVLPLAAVLVARIWNEERLLNQELAGYREYSQLVKYRLIPWVW